MTRTSPYVFGGQLVQQGGRLGQVVNPEDHQDLRRAGLQAAVGVVNVNPVLAQPRGCAPQLGGTVRQPDDGHVGLLEDHVQAGEHFPGAGHVIGQIRLQMAATLKAVISQRLVRRADDAGRVPAVEIMIATAYIRDCIINPDKTRLIHDAIAAGTSQYGMQTFDQSLFDLYTKQLITLEEALGRSSNPDEFRLRIQGIRSASDSAREEMERQMADFERFARK